MERKKLVEQLMQLQEQEKQIREQLNSMDYDQRFADAKQYEGRYFKENEEYHKECIRCLYVYSTDKVNCTPMSLCISYWLDNEDSYFTIDFYSLFYPKKWVDDDGDKWIEISKEEYMEHYEQVQRRIVKAIKTGI